MPLTSRVLLPSEYHRLVGTEAEAVCRDMPSSAQVVVIEDGETLVGCHVLVPILHAECLWVHPAHRGKTAVARRLWASVQRVAREHFGASWFCTGAESDDVRTLLAHVGAVRLPCDHYMVPVKG